MDRSSRALVRVLAFAASFVVLTILGAWWSLSRASMSLFDLGRILAMPSAAIALLAALCAGIYATDIFRYKALGAAVGAPISWRAGLDASVANFFFSWIMPGSTFGAPATIFMLRRQGVPWDAAVVMAFGKAFTGVAIMIVASLLLVALGLGPDYDERLLGIVFFGGSVFTILFALMVLAALRPEAAQRVVGGWFVRLRRRFAQSRVLGSVETVTLESIVRLSRLREGGFGPLVAIALSHLFYFAAFIGVGVVLIYSFGGAVDRHAFAATIVYVTFTYVAPTPGGAGFAEAMAIPFFGPILPPERAVAMVLMFRALTLYLQVGFGLPYMIFVGGLREIIAKATQPDSKDNA